MKYKKIIIIISAVLSLGLIKVNASLTTDTLNHAKTVGRLMAEPTATYHRSKTMAAESLTVPKEAAYLAFEPSLAQRQNHIKQWLEQMRTYDEEAAKSLTELASQQDLIQQLQTTLAPVGLTINNLADAYTVWWISAWYTSQGKPLALEKDTVQAVQKQAMQALVKSASFTQATNEVKQEMAESLLLQVILLDILVAQVQDDPLALQQLEMAIKADTKNAGLDLDEMTLTPQGFLPRK